jgi:hypothetical protein
MNSVRPGPLGLDPFDQPPRNARTPGVGEPARLLDPLRVGDTPGPLGINDWADPGYQLASAGRPVAVSQETRLTFSEHAEKRMWDLLKAYEGQVGSHRSQMLRERGLPDDTRGKSPTDCITYVIQVLKYAHDQIGRRDVARRVGALGQYGTELAAYLVGLGWKAHYWNPDALRPRDGDNEHPASYRLVARTGRYYRIPVSGVIVNYSPTPLGGGDAARGARETPKTQAAFDRFSQVKFAYGLARGGTHTFLCSYGMIFEVHWENIGADLYERSAFYSYPWLSGVMVTPPDAAFTSDRIK